MSVLPFRMTVNELCGKAKITRQWLNKLVDRGEVPCCSRKSNDRLAIGDSPDLNTWIEKTAKRQKKKQGRRLSLKERIDRFNRIPDLEEYTVSDLSKKIGVTVSTVRRRILEIQSAFYDGKSYRIKNTPDLKAWIRAEVTARLQERESLRSARLARNSLRDLKAPFLHAGAAVSKAGVEINRVLMRHSLKTWGIPELLAFRNDLRYMISLSQDIDSELGRRKKQVELD